MAYFEGTVEEFMRFLGGYARNRVQSLTSAYRKKIGKCEECGSHTKQLDAAHLHGKERLVIIGEILKDFTEDGVVKIDLNVFQEIFDQEPHPASGILRNVGICLQEDGLELIQVLHFQAVAFSPLVQDLRTVGLQLLVQFLQQPPHGFCAQAHLLREFIHRFIFVLRYQA